MSLDELERSRGVVYRLFPNGFDCVLIRRQSKTEG